MQLLRPTLNTELGFDRIPLDILDYCNAIKKRFKVDHITVIGHSLGGLIALRMSLIDKSNKYIVQAPYLGLFVSPSCLIASKLIPQD